MHGATTPFTTQRIKVEGHAWCKKLGNFEIENSCTNEVYTAVRATMYGVRTTKSSGLELLHVQQYICAYVGNKW
jgi:hypothetical protein